MLISDPQQLTVSPTDSMRSVIEVIDRAELQVALVTDSESRLVGTITDGDVRRALLRGMRLDDLATTVMNTLPVVATTEESESAIQSLMQATGLRRIPVVNDDGQLVGLAIPRSESGLAVAPNLVVIMAGGLGSRLEELTQDRPKPLLEVGAKPMLETIIERFVNQGLNRILIAVNYKADMIKGYFGDGTSFGAAIDYLHEEKRLGTAGALQYLPDDLTEPFIVVNADVLTTVDYRKLLTFHAEASNDATMGVSCHDVQIPFGVVKVNDQLVEAIDEKPVYRYFVNAGIYVLEPSCLQHIPNGEYFDMTSLLGVMLESGRKISSYPIHEYWQDVGRKDDYERANRDFGTVFQSRSE